MKLDTGTCVYQDSRDHICLIKTKYLIRNVFSNINLFLWSSNTLQVGSVVRAIVFIIAALTLMANLFDYKLNPRYSWPIDIFLITVVVALMVIAGVRIVMTTYHESRKLCWISFGFISLYSIIGLY